MVEEERRMKGIEEVKGSAKKGKIREEKGKGVQMPRVSHILPRLREDGEGRGEESF